MKELDEIKRLNIKAVSYKIKKRSIRLSNSTGIIDSGYREYLIGNFDCIDSSVTVKKYDRLLQIVAPGIVPIIVQIVNTIEELSQPTKIGIGEVKRSTYIF